MQVLSFPLHGTILLHIGQQFYVDLKGPVNLLASPNKRKVIGVFAFLKPVSQLLQSLPPFGVASQHSLMSCNLSFTQSSGKKVT